MSRRTKSVEESSRYGACQQDIAQNPVTLFPEKRRQIIPATGDSIEGAHVGQKEATEPNCVANTGLGKVDKEQKRERGSKGDDCCIMDRCAAAQYRCPVEKTQAKECGEDQVVVDMAEIKLHRHLL